VKQAQERAGSNRGSFTVDSEVAEPWEGTVGVSGLAELSAVFSNSLLPRGAEPGGGPDQIDEFRPHGQPDFAILEKMEAVGDGAYVSLHDAYCGRCKWAPPER
jgi:hypothetical protein